jgi:hypothetical protein
MSVAQAYGAAVRAIAPRFRVQAYPKRSAFRIVALTSLILVGCSDGMSQWDYAHNGVGVIMPEERAHLLEGGCPDLPLGKGTGYWTPTLEDIGRVEGKLAEILARELQGEQSGLTPRAYVRQYAGMTLGGETWIVVRGTHAELISALTDAHMARPFYIRWFRKSPEDPAYWRGGGLRFCNAGRLVFAVAFDAQADTSTPVSMSK